MKIGELAKRTGLSAHTLRYYERIGLLPRAHRGPSKQRDYDSSILTWIEFIQRLKTTKMPLRQMLLYARLRERGASTELQRAALLAEHRAVVRAHVAELQSCLKILDRKIAGYHSNSSKKELHHVQRREK
jgi:DNA-binding transcriptional MerR regulator